MKFLDDIVAQNVVPLDLWLEEEHKNHREDVVDVGDEASGGLAGP